LIIDGHVNIRFGKLFEFESYYLSHGLKLVTLIAVIYYYNEVESKNIFKKNIDTNFKDRKKSEMTY